MLKLDKKSNVTDNGADNRRDGTIDALRALCLIWIAFVWHLDKYINVGWTSNKICLMTLIVVLAAFFFISGYLLSKRYAFATKGSIKNFYFKRIVRIFPLFLVAVLTFSFRITLRCKILTVLGFSTYFPPSTPTLWFVSMLVGFYLATPLLCRLSLCKSTFLAIVAYITFYIVNFYYHRMDDRFLLYFPYYFLGLLCGRKQIDFSNWIVRFTPIRIVAVQAICIGVVGLFSLTPYVSEKNISPLTLVSHFWIPFGLVLLYLFADQCYKYLKCKKCFQILAYSGFTAYLFHRQIYYVVYRLVAPEKYLVLFIFISFTAIIIASFAIQYGYDRLFSLLAFEKRTPKPKD